MAAYNTYGFKDADWMAYLGANPDLGAAGITTAAGAQQHWNQYGKNEGRNLGLAQAAVQPRMPNYADDGKMYAGGNPYFDESAGGDFVPGVSQPPTPGGLLGGFNNGWGTTGGQQSGGLTIGGKTYTQQQVQDFYKNGGDDAQFAYDAGVKDPWQRRELLLQARGIAGNTYSGDAALKHYFNQYQQQTPNGAYANNYQGWLNDMPAQYKDAMKSGTYTGQAFTPKDSDFGGIYGPGTGHDVSFEQGRYGMNPHQSGSGSGGSSGNLGYGGGYGGGSGSYGGGSGGGYGGSSSSYSSSSGGLNPYLDQMAGSITNQLNSNWERNLAPSIRSGAMAAGGFGGSRQGVVEANGLRDLNQTLGNSLANLYGTGWQNAQQNALQNKSLDNSYALGVMNNNLGYANLDSNNSQFGANLALNTLNAQNNWAQNGVNAANQMQQAPLQYQQYFNQMQNSIGGQGQTNTTSQTNQGNPWLGAVGGLQLANSWIK